MNPREELEEERSGGEAFAPREVQVFEVRGSEARDFLQRMLTQDVASLKPGQGARACLTDRLARVVGAMELLATEEGFLALVDPACLEALIKALRIYVFASKVEITDPQEDTACLELVGPGLDETIRGLGGTPPPEANWSHLAATLGSSPQATIPVHLVRSPRLGPGGLSLIHPAAATQTLTQLLLDRGWTALSEDDARSLRVLAGTAVFGVDYQADAMPTEVGLEDAVSYRKGCYVGQEILERMRSRGKKTRLLTCLELPENPHGEADLTVYGQDALGVLTSLAPSPGGKGVVGLVSLPHQEIEKGTSLRVADLEARIKEFS